MKYHCFFAGLSALMLTLSGCAQTQDTTTNLPAKTEQKAEVKDKKEEKKEEKKDKNKENQKETQKAESDTAAPSSIQTTVDAGPYPTAADQKEALADYTELEDLSFDSYSGPSMGTYVIPGLYSTASIGKDGQLETCTEMTPQGITADDSHIYISGYCHKHEHDSVIFQLDKETGDLEKTIVLDGKPHTGSIAYDPDRNVIWVAAHSDHHATANAISMEEIANTDGTSPVKWKSIQELEELPKDSFLTWKDGSLYAGTFSKSGDMEIHEYTIDGNGKLTHKAVKDKPLSTDEAAANMQGIAFADGYFLTSCSDGPHMNSLLSVFSDTQDDYIPADAQKTVTLPPRSEQIWTDGDTLLVLFESGSAAYRNEGLVCTRVLSIDLNKLLQ